MHNQYQLARMSPFYITFRSSVTDQVLTLRLVANPFSLTYSLRAPYPYTERAKDERGCSDERKFLLQTLAPDSGPLLCQTF